MSKHLLRDDHECQNCGHTVEENYCPHCGQMNTETRQSFMHLAAHFAEDLTHYDGAFWKTIKYLLFRPAKLTQEYLQGKRMAYVPPVKLYIFISFITFFIPALLPESNTNDNFTVHGSEKPETVKHIRVPSLTSKEDVWFSLSYATDGIPNPMSYKSIREMDSIELLKPEPLRLSSFEHKIGEKMIKLYTHNSPAEVSEKFATTFFYNIPKALFVYLPIFAFWLWLFHSKKRWYFFEHGIFTLHYFSFLLITIIILIISYSIVAFFNNNEPRTMLILGTIYLIIISLIFLYQIYYFYRAHRKMYNESWIVNFLKSSLMFVINIFSILAVIALFFYITIYNLH